MSSQSSRVLLSAGNITHYHHAALALQNAGLLKRYLYSFALRANQALFYRFFPSRMQNKLRGRAFPGLDPNLVRTLPASEVIKRILLSARLISTERGDVLFANLFDLSSRRYISGCDIYHFVNSIGWHSGRRARDLGCVTICDVRNAHPDCEGRLVQEEYDHLHIDAAPPGAWLDGLLKREYAIADYLIVPSEYVRRTFVEAGIPENQLFVVPYGVSVELFSSQREALDSESEHPFRVLYVGGIVPRKGVHYLIEAFQRFEPPDAELILVGNILEEMKPLVEQAINRDPRIRHIGHVPQIELKKIYQQASLFVLPTVSEGSARVVYEAMAAGLPVITTTNAGAVVEDGVSGYVIPIRDVEALGEKLHTLYHHAHQRAEMGRAAALCAQRYTWEHYGQRLVAVYEQIWQATSQPNNIPTVAGAATGSHSL